jgi:hypothetical protein
MCRKTNVLGASVAEQQRPFAPKEGEDPTRIRVRRTKPARSFGARRLAATSIMDRQTIQIV